MVKELVIQVRITRFKKRKIIRMRVVRIKRKGGPFHSSQNSKP